jgi:hypothetical protein
LMHVEVSGGDGKILYSRLVSGQGERNELTDEMTLDIALQSAVRDLFNDSAFCDAILAAGRAAARTS